MWLLKLAVFILIIVTLRVALAEDLPGDDIDDDPIGGIDDAGKPE